MERKVRFHNGRTSNSDITVFFGDNEYKSRLMDLQPVSEKLCVRAHCVIACFQYVYFVKTFQQKKEQIELVIALIIMGLMLVIAYINCFPY